MSFDPCRRKDCLRPSGHDGRCSTGEIAPGYSEDEEIVFVPPSVRKDVRIIAFENGAEYDDVAEAFRTVRDHVSSDAEALEVLRKIAPQARTAGFPEMAYYAAEIAAGRGVRVEGGQKAPPLPPARELGAPPDPEALRMVQAGAMAYHLDSLRQLEGGEEGLLFRRVASIADEQEVQRKAQHGIAESRAARSASTRVDAEPCRSAPCRTFDDCLCSCRKCRSACSGRKGAFARPGA